MKLQFHLGGTDSYVDLSINIAPYNKVVTKGQRNVYVETCFFLVWVLRY